MPGTNSENTSYRRMKIFFEEFFGIQIDKANMDEVSFPTFEEALGVIELAIKREEGFRGWGSKSQNSDMKLQRYRQSMIFLIATVLERTLRDKAIHHGKLVQRLKRERTLNKSAFVRGQSLF